MAAGDFGFIPVADAERLVGTLTDRDIVVRAVAKGGGATSLVSEAMTAPVTTVLDSADLKVALEAMSSGRIRRLPVLDKHDRLVGVVSLGDLSTRVKEKYAGEALESISRAG